MLKYISICLILLCGCFSNKINEQEIINSYDCNSLKTTEKSYKISDIQNINVYDNNKKTYIQFDDCWYIVHSDFIKTFNENQDFIIKNLTNKQNSNKKRLIIIECCLFIIIFINLIIFYVNNRTK